MSYKQHNGWPPLPSGTKVRTNPKSDAGWTQEGIDAREPNKIGEIDGFSDSHGLCYHVEYEDGGGGFFNPDELTIIEQCVVIPKSRFDQALRHLVEIQLYPLNYSQHKTMAWSALDALAPELSLLKPSEAWERLKGVDCE